MPICGYMKDNLTCKVFADRGEMGKFAAKSVADKMREFLAERPEINMVFAAAPSQNEILKYLAEEKLNWSRVKAFYMDECVGLEEGGSKTFAHYPDKSIVSQGKA